jgi:anti-anti-sigma factor
MTSDKTEISPGIKLAGDEAIIEIAGYLNRGGLEEFCRNLELAEETGARKVVLNCSHLMYMDSSIIGQIVETHRRLQSMERALVLRWVSEGMLRVLEMACLDALLNVEADRRTSRAASVAGMPPKPALGELKRCWELYGCGAESCQNYNKQVYACWLTPHVPCKSVISKDLSHEIASCVKCEVFKNNINQFSSIHEHVANYIRDAEAVYLRVVGDKAHLERNLQALEGYAASLFTEATDAILTIDPEGGQILAANPQAQRILGLSETPAHDRSLFFFSPDLRVPPRPWEYSPLTRDSHHRRWDQEWISVEGERHIMEVTYSPISAPKPGSMLVVARDVTFQRSSESARGELQRRLGASLETLKAAAQRYHRYNSDWDPKTLCLLILQDALEVTPQADAGLLLLFDKGDEHLKVAAAKGYKSPGPLQWLKLSPGESIPGLEPGVFWGSLDRPVPKRDSLGVDRAWQDALGGLEDRWRLVRPMLGKDRKVGFLVLHSFQPGEGLGPPDPALLDSLLEAGAFAIERTMQAAASRRAEAQVRELLDKLPAPVFSVDESGAITTWNPAAALRLGWSAEEVIGKPADTVWAGQGAGSWEAIEKSLERKETWEGEVLLKSRAGGISPTRLHASRTNTVADTGKGIVLMAEPGPTGGTQAGR